MCKLTGYYRGVNLGGWLSQCDNTVERYKTFITEKDFADISARKFDHVRVPVDYNLFEDNNGNFVKENLSYISFAIDMCRKYNLNMILDLHKTPGFSFDPFHGEKGFFESKDYQEHFYKIWEMFAEEFGKYKDMLIFELLNEVTDKAYSDTWNMVSTECIRRIRAIAPDIRIIIGGYHNNALEAVKDLPMPYDDNIIYTFHCYEPLLFTHQGAYWIASMDHDFRCDYKMPFAKYDEISKILLSSVFYETKGLAANEVPDESYFENLLSEAIKTANERGVSLYCGEYGVIDKADRSEAAKWFKDFHAVLDRHQIGRAVWNYKQMDFEVAGDF